MIPLLLFLLVGLEPIAFDIQPQLRIVCLYVLRQFYRLRFV